MSSRDGRHHIVFNGEIYNFVELRAELKVLGHLFVSASDTEVLIAAFRQWGTDALKRLVGMFAFALLDCDRRTLLIGRDCFGIKPFYFTRWRNGLAFASEIKALLTLPGLSRTINPQRAFDYARFGITDHGDETMFAEVHQLPPAHWAEIRLDEPLAVVPKQYWKINLGRACDITFDEAVAHTRELFLESVRLHLRSDVPVGAALSGGVDSSAIVSAIRHLAPEQDIHTFSYIADEPSVSEDAWVNVVGSSVRAKIHKVSPSPEDLGSDLERLIGLQDEPFGSTTIYAQYRVFKLAGDAGIKVMLDGQGADEMLGGYRSYLAGRLATLIKTGRWRAARKFLQQASNLGGAGSRELLMQAGAALIPTGLHGQMRRLARRELHPQWMNQRWLDGNAVEPTSLVEEYRGDVLRDMLYYSLTRTSLPALLRYEDRNSMTHSIESRVPFLTPQLASFFLSLPEAYLIGPDGETKRVFRAAMRGLVPDAVLDRRDKIGFDTPERRWICELAPWVNQILKSDAAERVRILDLAAVRRDWQRALAGQSPFDNRIWRWINLIRWAENCDVVFE